MNFDSSDATHDLGRMDSERQMRNRPTKGWLDDVVKQAEDDHEALMSDFEARKGSIDAMHDGFLDSLDAALATQTVDRKHQVQTLLDDGDALLAIYKAAGDAVSATFAGEDLLQGLQRKHREDVQRLKDVLVVGKRICAGELEAVGQQARARELMGNKEVFEQAAGIFGGPRVGGGGEGLERTLGYVERGVKKMVKGMD